MGCERIQGLDGRVYLLLADGRGWAFDDSALIPHDPSVVRGRWTPMEAAMELGAAYPAPMPMQYFEQPLATYGMEDAKKKSSRRKRGGVKHNKNKSAESNLYNKAGTYAMAEVDTDT